MPVKKRSANVWVKFLAGVLGTAATVWIIVVTLGAVGTRDWEVYAASLRAKGQPLTFDEIEARRAVIAEDQNSARVIERLFAELNDRNAGSLEPFSSSGSQSIGDLFEGMRADRLEAARQFVLEHQATLAKLGEIIDKPQGRFTITFDRQNPIATFLPHVNPVRTASKLLYLDSVVRLVDGDRATVFRNFELQCRLAATLGDEPILISRLVQIAVQSMAVQTAEAMLRTGTLEPAQLAVIAKELQAMRSAATLRWALLGERAFFVESCEALASGRLSLPTLTNFSGSPGAGVPGLPGFIMRSNQLVGTQLHTSLIDAIDNPAALLAAAKKMEQDIPHLSRTQVLVKLLLPSLTRAITLHVRQLALLDSAIAAVAAERFRMAEGRFPAATSELVPGYLAVVPADPFDGKPLRLAKTANGIIVYSVNEDGADDGGDVRTGREKKKNRPLDVGFRLTDVEQRKVPFLAPPAEE